MGMKKVLRESLDTFAPVIDEGTVLIAEIPVTPREENGTEHLTYALLYVGGKWYSTGDGRGPLAHVWDTTGQMMTQIGRYPGATVRLVTGTEVIR